MKKIKELLETNKIVKFKLFSLDYIIKQEDNSYIVYPTLYEKRQNKYDSLDEALNNFMVYNESLIENEDRIIILK